MMPRGSHVVRGALFAAVLALATLWLPRPLAALIVVAAALFLVMVPGERSSSNPTETLSDEQTLVTSEFAHLIEPLAEGLLLLNANRAVVAANDAASRILGRPSVSMFGASLIVALRDHDLAEVVRRASGQPVRVHVSSSGHDVLATATHVESGPVHTLLVLQDVTELEQARRARADLIANMSHELRTPIAAARALAETLQSGVEDATERARFHDRLVEEVARLGAMVDRLLRLARLESGSEALDRRPLEPGALLQTAAARVEPVAHAAGVQVQIVPGDAPPPVYGDPDRLVEVLLNLLDNALRFSPQGATIRMRAVADHGSSGEEVVRFEVSDEGPGILPADRERVFERFYTGNAARQAGAGTGLGLSIARHIVERLGGRIWVDDNSSRGATFCFTLPVVQTGEAPMAAG